MKRVALSRFVQQMDQALCGRKHVPELYQFLGKLLDIREGVRLLDVDYEYPTLGG